MKVVLNRNEHQSINSAYEQRCFGLLLLLEWLFGDVVWTLGLSFQVGLRQRRVLVHHASSRLITASLQMCISTLNTRNNPSKTAKPSKRLALVAVVQRKSVATYTQEQRVARRQPATFAAARQCMSHSRVALKSDQFESYSAHDADVSQLQRSAVTTRPAFALVGQTNAPFRL